MKTQHLVRLLPLGLFIALTFLLFRPYFLDGKVPLSTNYLVSTEVPYKATHALPYKNSIPDIFGQIYPWKRLTITALQRGEFPLWDPYNFSGNGHFGNLQTAVLSPFNGLFFFLNFVDAWSFMILLQILLASSFTYLYCRSLGLSRLGSTFAGISFGFCGFMTVWLAYGTLGYAILYLPLALWCIENLFGGRRGLFVLGLGASVFLSVFSGHIQTSLYFVLAITIYSIVRFITAGMHSWRPFLWSVVAVFFGLIISSVQILVGYDLFLQSARSESISSEFFRNGLIPLDYLITLLHPDFYGNPVTGNDWYGRYAEWSGYIGIVPFFLALGALPFVRKRLLPVLIVGVVGILLSVDTPVGRLPHYLNLPILATSAGSRAIVLFSFGFAVLAGYGIDLLRRGGKLYVYVFSLGFAIVFGALGGMYMVQRSNVTDANLYAVSFRNMLFTSGIFGLGFLVILAFFWLKRFRSLLLILLLVIVSADLLRFSIKWMPFESRAFLFPDHPLISFLEQQPGYYRHNGTIFQPVNTYFGLYSPSGYDPLSIQRYGRFVEAVQDGRLMQRNRSAVTLQSRGKYTRRYYDLMGIKYIVHEYSSSGSDLVFPIWLTTEKEFPKVYDDSQYAVYVNKSVMPRAYVVNDYEVYQDENALYSRLMSDEFDMRKKVVLETDPGIRVSDGASGSATIERYRFNSVLLRVESPNDGIVVLTDTFASGWRVLVDGVERPILRTNFTFRGVAVGAGQHTVEFFYSPYLWELGVRLSMIGTFLLFVVAFMSARFWSKSS